MTRELRLESAVGSPRPAAKSRRSEQVARSEAKCQAVGLAQDDRLAANGAGRAGRHARREAAPAAPSFLVQESTNVNGAEKLDTLARILLTMWDFEGHRGRVAKRQMVFVRRDDPRTAAILPGKNRSRYFDEGRSYAAWKIRKRLGKYGRVQGLMETLTYDPKKIGVQEAWARYGQDVRRFLNAVNEYRKRRGWRRPHYLWVVEVQRDTGYPHVHIFFPNLRWLAKLEIIKGNWSQGRANIAAPKKLTTNCAGYICKYLSKMEGWEDRPLALLWKGGCRMYGFSRGFSAKEEKKEAEWELWHIMYSDNPEQLAKSLEDGGYLIEEQTKGRRSRMERG